MKLATWNVNSLTVRLPQVLDWLRANPVDVLALQELKLTDDKFPFAALAEAATLAPRVVMLVLNADDAPSPANPFDNDTRGELLRAGMAGDTSIVWLRDRRYEPARWAAAAAARRKWRSWRRRMWCSPSATA